MDWVCDMEPLGLLGTLKKIRGFVGNVGYGSATVVGLFFGPVGIFIEFPVEGVTGHGGGIAKDDEFSSLARTMEMRMMSRSCPWKPSTVLMEIRCR